MGTNNKTENTRRAMNEIHMVRKLVYTCRTLPFLLHHCGVQQPESLFDSVADSVHCRVAVGVNIEIIAL